MSTRTCPLSGETAGLFQVASYVLLAAGLQGAR